METAVINTLLLYYVSFHLKGTTIDPSLQILMLTARGEENDRAAGLRIRVKDYWTGTFTLPLAS